MCVVRERYDSVHLVADTKRLVSGWMNCEVMFDHADERCVWRDACQGCSCIPSRRDTCVVGYFVCSYLVFPMSFNHINSHLTNYEGVVRHSKFCLCGRPCIGVARSWCVVRPVLSPQSLVIEVHSSKPVLISVVEKPVSVFVAALIERTKARGVSRNVRPVHVTRVWMPAVARAPYCGGNHAFLVLRTGIFGRLDAHVRAV